MGKLRRSPNAISALPKFHKAEYIVWVEGIDDVSFWKCIFEKCGYKNCKFKPSGGKNELKYYISLAVDNTRKLIVAADADYSVIDGNSIKHPQVIYTNGYSVENDIYCPININTVVNTYGRTDAEIATELNNWYEKQYGILRELIAIDYANAINDLPHQVIGDSAQRYLVNDNSIEFSEEKVQKRVAELNAIIEKSLISNALTLLNSYVDDKYKVIKGHFLTSVVRNVVKHYARKLGHKANLSISDESLFASFLLGCKGCGIACEEIEKISNYIHEAQIYAS